MSKNPAVCDYEGSDYRSRFWEQGGRDYEDWVERIALRRLMPPSGGVLLDIGAGFGRLANEFGGYSRVVLFDYSRSLLREAQAHLADDPRFVFVTGNWYQMPFVDGLFDTLVQVRTIHHAADVPALFQQLRRITVPNGHYILEFASKHHLKAILRYWLGRQRWSPFQLQPLEFVELNFDFHPRWMNRQLSEAGFEPSQTLTVSHFRLPIIKRLIPTRLLVFLDSLAQLTGRWWQLTPSVFVYSRSSSEAKAAAPGSFFACPRCRSALDQLPDSIDNGLLTCPNETCGARWSVKDGLFDFKEPD
jgi:SAM-dependent methyltransferase